ncbi:MAG: tripartite tricarboxylate transporter TctB family protein [Granulosicoccus sp.]
MTPKSVQLHLGAIACLISLFLIFIGIPNGVSSPSNVPNIVLAPTFWPYVLASFTGLTGLGLLFAGWRHTGTDTSVDEPDNDAHGWLRLAALVLIMVITMFALPRLGMVWTTMLVFFVTALLFRTRHPRTALVCAIVIPLCLYVFFAHVAGVGIPQGDFVRLP